MNDDNSCVSELFLHIDITRLHYNEQNIKVEGCSTKRTKRNLLTSNRCRNHAILGNVIRKVIVRQWLQNIVFHGKTSSMIGNSIIGGQCRVMATRYPIFAAQGTVLTHAFLFF